MRNLVSKLHYTVDVEYLPDGPCTELEEVCDGIRYRAQILRGNAKIVQLLMLEPVEVAFIFELPLFVLGMTHLRLVRNGKVTPEGKVMILGKMKALVRAANTEIKSPTSPET